MGVSLRRVPETVRNGYGEVVARNTADSRDAELSMGSIFCDPTQPINWQTQPSPIQPKFVPIPKPIELRKILNCLRQQAARLETSNLIMQSSTII